MQESYLDLNTTHYKRDDNEVIHELSSNVKKSKILFYISTICILLTLGLVLNNLIIAPIGLIANFYFLIMIMILLPKINVFNKDALDIRNKDFEEIENKVLAVFPVDNAKKNKEWMIFVQTADKEYIELEIPCDLGNIINEGDTVCVKYTKNTKTVMDLIKK